MLPPIIKLGHALSTSFLFHVQPLLIIARQSLSQKKSSMPLSQFLVRLFPEEFKLSLGFENRDGGSIEIRYLP